RRVGVPSVYMLRQPHRRIPRAASAALVRFWLVCALLPAFCVPARTQEPPPAETSAKPAHESGRQGAQGEARPGYPAGSAQEVVPRDSPATFKVRVNLVLVRVVVRDERGKIIDNLKKEDFQIFDNRKPQTISTFSVETPLSHAVPVVSVSD